MSQTRRLLEYRFPARAEQVRAVRQRVRELLEGLGCGRQYIDYTVLAIAEAISNVIRHAYRGDEDGEIVLEVLRRGDEMRYRLIDFAPPVDRAAIRSRDLDDVRPGGLGVHIIREVMDSMEFVTPEGGTGNILEMARKLET